MASSQYNSVFDMFKNNTAKPQAIGEPPVYDEPDPNAPIYSMYGNNQFGSPVLPDQKPAFNSVYDIYGQGKMNDFSAGAGKTPTSPLDKPNANPLIGNVAKAPVASTPFAPPDPTDPYQGGISEESGVGDSPYTPGAGPATPIDLTPKQPPKEPGAPPPLDKQPNDPSPPSPPGGGSGGGGGGSPPSKPELDSPRGGEGDGGPQGETDQERNDRVGRENEKNRQEWEKINNEKKQQQDLLDLLERLFGAGITGKTGVDSKVPPKPEADPIGTTWDGKNWIIHFSDGSTKVSDPFANVRGKPADAAPPPKAGGAKTNILGITPLKQ